MDQSDGRKARSGSTGTESSACGIPNNFPANTVLVDRTGRIAYVSDRFTDLAGRPRTKLIGRKIARLFHSGKEADDPLPDDLTKAALKDHPMRLARPDAAPLDVHLCSDRWLDPDGTIYAALVVTDASDTAAARRERDEAQLLLQTALDPSGAGTWSWNIQTGACSFSPRCAAILGYDPDKLARITVEEWRAMIHPPDLEQAQAALARYFDGTDPAYDVDLRMYSSDGGDVWVRCYGLIADRTDDGAPVRMIGTHLEIEQAKVSEEERRRSLGMLDRMGQIAGVGGWEVDLKSNSILWTKETRRIHGVDDNYTPDLASGINFYAPDARETISAAVERGMTSGEPWDLELPFIRQNGSRIWVRAMGEVEFEDGQPVRLIGAFQDITQRVKTQNEMLAAQEWIALSAEKGRVGLWSLDAVMGQLSWDRQMSVLFGRGDARPPTTVAAWADLLHDDMQDQLKQAIRRTLFSKTDMEVELTFTAANGPRVIKLVGAPHADQDGMVDRIQGACFDLTEQRSLMSKLQEQATKLSVTLTSIGDGVITTDEHGHIAWMNPEAERLTGWSLPSAMERDSSDILDIYDQATGRDIPNPILCAIQDRKTVGLPKEAMLRRPDGTSIAIDDSASPLFDEARKVFGAVMVFRDTTEQRDHSRDIEFRATHDPLTGLLNRAAFFERLKRCLADPAARLNSYLLAIDLDHFKRVNDSLGHDAGDTVLCRIADILTDSAGDTGTVARLGGDEFSILTRNRDINGVKSLAASICERISAGTFLRRSSDTSIRIGASIGVMPLNQPDLTSTEAMKCADIAAYSAKNAGRGRVRIWSATEGTMLEHAGEGSLIHKIEDTMAAEAWIVEAQPVRRDIRKDGPVAFRELLIRMPGVDGQPILPGEFLPAAQRYGLMPPIDLWMLSHAIARISKEIEADQDVAYSVNICAASIVSQDFQNKALDLISDAPSSVRPRLHLEINEDALLRDFGLARHFLARVRALGPRIAIDAFGAGISTIRHFKDLPADYLKIDGSLTRNLCDAAEADNIAFFTRMARAAELQTVAAHIEDEAQIAQLKTLDVDLFQGFAIDHPS